MQHAYDSTILTPVPGARVAIVQAAWHSEHTDRMVEVCRDLLERTGCTEIQHHVVPGSYELPLAAKLLAKTRKLDAIVIFGAVVRGETDHYHVIVDTCIRELGKVMYEFEIPVIMELMPVEKLEHLIARTTGENNKGIEAAQAAARMIRWRRENKL